MTDEVPVVVVGGGPVGMTAALLLAAYGVPAVVLEREPRHEAVGSRSICTQRDVLDVLDRAGAAQPLVDEGVTWTVGRTYYRGHEVGVTTFAEVGRSAYPPFVNVPQSFVEEVLAARVADEPLVTLRRGHAVTGLAQDDAGVTLTVSTPDGPSRLRTAWVLACDGARSSVRALLGLAFDGHSYDDRFLIADIRADLGFEAERRFFFDPDWNPGRQVLVHPQPRGVWRVDWQVPADVDLDADRASGALDARVRQVTGEAPYALVWVSAYRFHQRRIARMRVGRVLLAGDAAHLMSPFGARGLNSGLADAENAAWRLAYVLRGWAPDALLRAYDAERGAAARENLRVTGETMRFLAPRTDAERAHRRDVLDRSLDDPAARAEIDSGRLYVPFAYAASPGVTPSTDVRAVSPGDLLPDAPVRVATDPGVHRVRQLFGAGLVALTTTGVDPGRVGRALRDAVTAPARVLGLDDIDAEGLLGRALAARPGEVWLLRPDGHVAAVVPAHPQDVLVAAVRRALGHTPTG